MIARSNTNKRFCRLSAELIYDESANSYWDVGIVEIAKLFVRLTQYKFTPWTLQYNVRNPKPNPTVIFIISFKPTRLYATLWPLLTVPCKFERDTALVICSCEGLSAFNRGLLGSKAPRPLHLPQAALLSLQICLNNWFDTGTRVQ